MSYLIFDIETIPDGKLISSVKYNGTLSAQDAIKKMAAEVNEQTDGKSSFIPVTYHVPVVVGYMCVDHKLNITDYNKMLGDVPDITSKWWEVYSANQPVLVSFNGRGFDLPVLELASLRYNITIPSSYFDKYGPRNRFGDGHIDLMEWISNYGAYRLSGGMDAISKMIGLPGKTSINGGDVYNLVMNGQFDMVVDYCMKDVKDTYAIFLRRQVVMGKLTISHQKDLLDAMNKL